jgi:hypothetical protein
VCVGWKINKKKENWNTRNQSLIRYEFFIPSRTHKHKHTACFRVTFFFFRDKIYPSCPTLAQMVLSHGNKKKYLICMRERQFVTKKWFVSVIDRVWFFIPQIFVELNI